MLRIRSLSCLILLATLGLAAPIVYPMRSLTRTYSSHSIESQDQKALLYTRWEELMKGGQEQQAAASEVAKDFLQKFGNVDDQQVQSVRTWFAKYERTQLEAAFNQAAGAKDYMKAFELGRRILSNDPENFRVLSVLVVTATLIGPPPNPDINREAANFARKAIQLLEANSASAPAPFATKDEAVGFLNFTLGRFLAANSPADAVVPLRKAALSKSVYSQDSATYYLLASAIAASEFTPLQAEYREKYEGKVLDANGRAMYERLRLIVERIIDAYARAVALSTKPEQQEFKNQLMAQLTRVYKSIHNDSDAGLNELIASVLAKPLP